MKLETAGQPENHPILGVVFDCGGVLTLGQDLGIVAKMADYLGIGPAKLVESYMEGRGEYDRGKLSAMDYWSSVAGRTGARFEPSMLPGLIELDMSSWFRHNRETIGLVLNLRAAGMRLFMLSNMNLEGRERLLGGFGELDGRDWISAFEAVLLSCDLGMVKPDAEIFEACAAISGIPPAGLFFVDDIEANVRAARACGFSAHRFADAASLASALREAGILAAQPSESIARRME